MLAGSGFAGEKARAFQHHIHAHSAPLDFAGVALGDDFDFVAIDHDAIAVNRNGARKFAVRGVVLRQVGIDAGIAQIVDGHDFDIVFFTAFIVGAQDIAADATITVDSDLDSHIAFLLQF